MGDFSFVHKELPFGTEVLEAADAAALGSPFGCVGCENLRTWETWRGHQALRRINLVTAVLNIENHLKRAVLPKSTERGRPIDATYIGAACARACKSYVPFHLAVEKLCSTLP